MAKGKLKKLKANPPYGITISKNQNHPFGPKFTKYLISKCDYCDARYNKNKFLNVLRSERGHNFVDNLL
jgi:hypothetical protein